MRVWAPCAVAAGKFLQYRKTIAIPRPHCSLPCTAAWWFSVWQGAKHPEPLVSGIWLPIRVGLWPRRLFTTRTQKALSHIIMARAALVCALLATTATVTTAGGVNGINTGTVIHECVDGNGKAINVAAGQTPKGSCMFTAKFERNYYSFPSGNCRGFRDCPGSTMDIPKFRMRGISGKRIRITKIGLCGEIDQGAGASAFKFTPNKGTPAWVSCVCVSAVRWACASRTLVAISRPSLVVPLVPAVPLCVADGAGFLIQARTS